MNRRRPETMDRIRPAGAGILELPDVVVKAQHILCLGVRED